MSLYHVVLFCFILSYIEGADNAVRVAFRMTQPFRFEFYVDGVMLPESEYDVSELRAVWDVPKPKSRGLVENIGPFI